MRRNFESFLRSVHGNIRTCGLKWGNLIFVLGFQAFYVEFFEVSMNQAKRGHQSQIGWILKFRILKVVGKCCLLQGIERNEDTNLKSVGF